MKVKRSIGEIIFDNTNILLLVLISLVTLYPLYYVLVASISDPVDVALRGGLMFLPSNIQFDAYKIVLKNVSVMKGYLNSIWYTGFGTFLSVAVTSLFAYGLSRKNVFFNKYIMIMMVITMFFSGGLIPSYLLMKSLGLTNGGYVSATLAMTLPGLISSFNVIVMRTNFQGIPDSLEESAKLDGANDLVIFWKIIVPLSRPIISVMVLFTSIGLWNSWFNAFIYLKDAGTYPLQLVLKGILISNRNIEMGAMLSRVKDGNVQDMVEVVGYAIIIAATLPILFIYPFIQKYFITGIRIGALKG